jgi:hypothetical protein
MPRRVISITAFPGSVHRLSGGGASIEPIASSKTRLGNCEAYGADRRKSQITPIAGVKKD